jgi:hypothetical protein
MPVVNLAMYAPRSAMRVSGRNVAVRVAAS